MMLYQCKCGKSESFGSIPPARCESCKECGSDLAVTPIAHRDPAPHEWKTKYNEDTGEPYEICRNCHKKKQIAVASLD